VIRLRDAIHRTPGAVPGTGRRPRAWHEIACGLAVLAALVTSCGGSSSSPSSSPPSSTSGKIKIPPSVGSNVLITNSGFKPDNLLAPEGKLTWKNVSSKTESVHFDNYDRRVDSGPIPPGGSWSFEQNSLISIVYHSTYDKRFHGHVEVANSTL
jgi:hypothetical protein